MRINLKTAFVLGIVALFTAGATATDFKPTCHSGGGGNGGYNGGGGSSGNSNPRPGKGPEQGQISGVIKGGGNAVAVPVLVPSPEGNPPGAALPVAILPGQGSGEYEGVRVPEGGASRPEAIKQAAKFSKRERRKAALAKRRAWLDAYVARNSAAILKQQPVSQEASLESTSIQPSSVALSYQPAAIGVAQAGK